MERVDKRRRKKIVQVLQVGLCGIANLDRFADIFEKEHLFIQEKRQ